MKWGLLFLCIALSAEEHIYLKTPKISREEVIGTSVGIRPYRKTGIRMEEERYGDKVVIHNYGYGGSGITLSLAGAERAVELVALHKEKTVAVLGAGVIGLATAYELLKKGYEVHLYADAWNPNLTSNVAAGIWSPLKRPYDMSEERKMFHQKLAERAQMRFLENVGENPEFAGVRQIWSYSFKIGDQKEAITTKHNGEAVIAHFDNGVTKKGKRIFEIGIEGNVFMDDLYAKVQRGGALLQEKRFSTLEDVLQLTESVVVNCMSLGSREVFGDAEFLPCRGQMVYFPQQEGTDYLLYQNVPGATDMWISIYPWNDRILLGGILEWGEEELCVNPAVIDRIIQNAEEGLYQK